MRDPDRVPVWHPYAKGRKGTALMAARRSSDRIMLCTFDAGQSGSTGRRSFMA
jgi:hypothetical protein